MSGMSFSKNRAKAGMSLCKVYDPKEGVSKDNKPLLAPLCGSYALNVILSGIISRERCTH